MENQLIATRNQVANTASLGERYTHTLSKSTRKTYSSDIKQFFGVTDFKDITVEMIQAVDTDMANTWALAMGNRGLKPSTINKKMSSLKSFYKFLCRRSVGIMTYNPFSTEEGALRRKNAISSYAQDKSLTDAEVEALFAAIPYKADRTIHKLQYERDYIILAFMLLTGCRREELVDIKIGDFMQSDNKHVVRIKGKGEKERLLIVPEDLYSKIVKYVRDRKLSMNDYDEPFITRHQFQRGIRTRGLWMSVHAVNEIVKKYVELAGLDTEKITPHALRHTFCTESLRAGAKLEDVQDLMGHSKIDTTRRYDHINRTIEHSTSDALSTKYASALNPNHEE
jgi:site-specific recombinase XerD